MNLPASVQSLGDPARRRLEAPMGAMTAVRVGTPFAVSAGLVRGPPAIDLGHVGHTWDQSK